MDIYVLNIYFKNTQSILVHERSLPFFTKEDAEKAIAFYLYEECKTYEFLCSQDGEFSTYHYYLCEMKNPYISGKREISAIIIKNVLEK